MTSREIDELVATKVMGWHHDYRFSQTHAASWRVLDEAGCHQIVESSDWSPSKDPAAAWQVVEKMRETHDVEIRCDRKGTEHVTGGYQVLVDGNYNMRGKTFPEAVCRAALKAREVEP